MLKQAKYLVEGDVFEHKGRTEVAIDNFQDGYIWVTKPGNYHGAKMAAGYTNTALIKIDGEAIISYEHIPTIAEGEETEDRWEDSFYSWR